MDNLLTAGDGDLVLFPVKDRYENAVGRKGRGAGYLLNRLSGHPQ